jgi:hypothetical protein
MWPAAQPGSLWGEFKTLKNIPQGLNGLRKKGEWQANSPKKRLRG